MEYYKQLFIVGYTCLQLTWIFPISIMLLGGSVSFVQYVTLGVMFLAGLYGVIRAVQEKNNYQEIEK